MRCVVLLSGVVDGAGVPNETSKSDMMVQITYSKYYVKSERAGVSYVVDLFIELGVLGYIYVVDIFMGLDVPGYSNIRRELCRCGACGRAHNAPPGRWHYCGSIYSFDTA